MYYLLLPGLEARSRFIAGLKERGVASVFHYIPLHSAPKGREIARAAGELAVTDATSDRLVRLPLWLGVEDSLDHVFESAGEVLSSL